LALLQPTSLVFKNRKERYGTVTTAFSRCCPVSTTLCASHDVVHGRGTVDHGPDLTVHRELAERRRLLDAGFGGPSSRHRREPNLPAPPKGSGALAYRGVEDHLVAPFPSVTSWAVFSTTVEAPTAATSCD
jgi:hypothetical protein